MPMQKLTIKFYAGALCLLAALFLPLGSFKTNRVMSGEDIALSGFFDGLMGIVPILIALMLLILLVSWGLLLGRQHRLLGLLEWAVLLLPLGVTMLLSQVPLVYLAQGSEMSWRVSPGVGYWLVLFGSILLSLSRGLKGFLRAPAKVAICIALVVLGLGLGWSPHFSLYLEFINERGRLMAAIGRHLALSLTAVGVAAPIGVAMGYWGHRRKRARSAVLGVVNFFQVVPTLTLLSLTMIPLSLLAERFPWLAEAGIRGVGFAPSVIVLTLYALLPVAFNALAGFDQVPAQAIESAWGMGFTSGQVFFRIKLPLALPPIVAGLRTALTQTVGNAILAGLIGGGGLGAIIFLGLSQAALDLVLLGALPVVLMALALDAWGDMAEQETNR